MSDQFTDAQMRMESNLSGVIGKIPSYEVLDFSASYKYKKLKLTGINNILDNYILQGEQQDIQDLELSLLFRNIYTTIEIRL